MEQNTIKERRYFGPSRFNEAKDAFKEVEALDKLQITTNFQNFDSIPQDHGVLFQPVLERKKGGGPLQLASYIVAHVPDLSVVSKSDAGTQYLVDALAELYGRRLKQDVAQAQSSHMKPKLPETLEEFISSEQRDNLFQNLMQKWVRKLKASGGSLSLLTQSIMKNCLMSSQFAKGYAPKVPQAEWDKVLDKMTEEAGQEGIDTAILKDWKANRADHTIDEAETLNLD